MTLSIPGNIHIPTTGDVHPHAMRTLAQHDAPVGTRATVLAIVGDRILGGVACIHHATYRRDADGWRRAA